MSQLSFDLHVIDPALARRQDAIKKRPCLRCSRSFETTPAIRTCSRCKSDPEYQSLAGLPGAASIHLAGAF